MIFFFVLITFLFVLWLGKVLRVKRSLTGVLACGCGICGVSAEIAAAPLMGASAAELAYCIGVPHAAFGGTIEHENGIPLHWRGVGVGCSERKDPPLKAEAFFPLPRGDFHGSGLGFWPGRG